MEVGIDADRGWRKEHELGTFLFIGDVIDSDQRKRYCTFCGRRNDNTNGLKTSTIGLAFRGKLLKIALINCDLSFRFFNA